VCFIKEGKRCAIVKLKKDLSMGNVVIHRDRCLQAYKEIVLVCRYAKEKKGEFIISQELLKAGMKLWKLSVKIEKSKDNDLIGKYAEKIFFKVREIIDLLELLDEATDFDKEFNGMHMGEFCIELMSLQYVPYYVPFDVSEKV